MVHVSISLLKELTRWSVCCGGGMNKVCTMEGFEELLDGEGGELSWVGECTPP